MNYSLLKITACFLLTLSPAFTMSVSAESPSKPLQITLGDMEYKAELILDEQESQITVQLLDKNGKLPVNADKPYLLINLKSRSGARQYKLLPVDQKSGPPSRFTVQHKILMNSLKSHDSNAVIRVFIDGKGYAGKVHFDNHDDHGHEH